MIWIAAVLCHEEPDLFEEVARFAEHVLDIVVASTIDPEWLCPIPPLAGEEELLPMPEGHHLVPSPVDDEDRRFNVPDPGCTWTDGQGGAHEKGQG